MGLLRFLTYHTAAPTKLSMRSPTTTPIVAMLPVLSPPLGELPLGVPTPEFDDLFEFGLLGTFESLGVVGEGKGSGLPGGESTDGACGVCPAEELAEVEDGGGEERDGSGGGESEGGRGDFDGGGERTTGGEGEFLGGGGEGEVEGGLADNGGGGGELVGGGVSGFEGGGGEGRTAGEGGEGGGEVEGGGGGEANGGGGGNTAAGGEGEG